MSELRERLRRGEPCVEGCGAPCRTMDAASGCLCATAAARIEQLEADLAHADAKGQENDKLLWGTIERAKKLEAALRDIDGCSAQAHVRRIARVALEERT